MKSPWPFSGLISPTNCPMIERFSMGLMARTPVPFPLYSQSSTTEVYGWDWITQSQSVGELQMTQGPSVGLRRVGSFLIPWAFQSLGLKIFLSMCSWRCPSYIGGSNVLSAFRTQWWGWSLMRLLLSPTGLGMSWMPFSRRRFSAPSPRISANNSRLAMFLAMLFSSLSHTGTDEVATEWRNVLENAQIARIFHPCFSTNLWSRLV